MSNCFKALRQKNFKHIRQLDHNHTRLPDINLAYVEFNW